MALRIKKVDKLPENAYTRGPRDSIVRPIVEELYADPTKVLSVEADSRQELDRLYKALIQWRSRHPERTFQLRKDVNSLYLWLPAPQ